MRTTRIRIIALAGLVLLLPAALRAQNGIVVIDFATGNAGTSSALTATGELRRGVTSSVKIIKSLLDLVPHNLISASGATLSNITQGQTSAGVGFVQMSVSVAGNAAVGSNVIIKVGINDQYPFRVVHKGQITTISFSPNPTTIQAGVSFVATVQGQDLGADPEIGPLGCHTSVPNTGNNTSFAMTLTRANNCTILGPFSFGVRSSGANDPNIYAKSSGEKSFSFGPYPPPPPPPPTGVVCTTANVGAPRFAAPANNQVIVFAPASDSIQPFVVRWQAEDVNGTLAPNNEFVYSRLALTPFTGPGRPTLGDIPRPTTRNVVGTQTTDQLRVPGEYSLTLRAFNCGQTGPPSTITFKLRFQ